MHSEIFTDEMMSIWTWNKMGNKGWRNERLAMTW